jgi:hypothetical protein
MEVGKMTNHSTEKLDILALSSDDESKFDAVYIDSRVVSENIIPEIVHSLKLLDQKEHHNKTLYLRDNSHNRSFGALCGLAVSMLNSYSTICIETSPGRHLIIKGAPEKVGKFLEGPKR